MRNYSEKPFEYLRRMENGKAFDKEIVKSWYIARAYVLEKLKDVAFGPHINEHLHVVVTSDSPLMLSVVRQVALSAHYINYDEGNTDESQRRRTVITLVSNNTDIETVLQKEEYLCNLTKYCKLVNGTMVKNKDSYIDIEIHIVKVYIKDENEKNLYIITEEDVDTFGKLSARKGSVYSIDTRKAVYANMVYTLGEVIDNLPAEDIHSAKRYTLALDIYQHEKLKTVPGKLINKDNWRSLSTVKEGLSNIFCSDCFQTRALEIQLCSSGNKKEDEKLWEKFNEALSISEHARWVVEKLIMGYSPLSIHQRFKDESLFYDKKRKAQYRKNLKKLEKNPTHIDLCSYADLRRINPTDMKYDSFLMLAIPRILKKLKE